MPRVEIIPANWEASQEKQRGDGAPTIDVCRDCHSQYFDFCEGESLAPDPHEPDDVDEQLKKLVKQFPGATIGSIEVAHPGYDPSDKATCAVCGNALTHFDD
jgi:hypothetical protein